MKDLKIGMIGLDTSHCNAFTKYLNAKRRKNRIKGGKVRYGFPGGSEKFSKSHSRVDKFTFKLATQYSVEILESIEDVAEKSDALLLESCDGRQHLEQFSRIAPYKKPVFIDKPLACSYSDAKEIANISKEEDCPFFSASSLRYYSGISDCLSKNRKGMVASVHAFGPVDLLDDYPGYYWYGVHMASIIYSFMGSG